VSFSELCKWCIVFKCILWCDIFRYFCIIWQHLEIWKWCRKL